MMGEGGSGFHKHYVHRFGFQEGTYSTVYPTTKWVELSQGRMLPKGQVDAEMIDTEQMT
jgi:hypothetical protein